ncbi:dTDP-4-dehydrorhamnose 3,5-epimerase family protein [Streptomyces sp. NPDC005794]|uniref:dTDP-4-dehydrorhamnose 3,5-epimerase family protein n=1 Tax=Streptomyces sp. NPDC005794 TaxID=3364733 RepID=UPI0036AED6C4
MTPRRPRGPVRRVPGAGPSSGPSSGSRARVVGGGGGRKHSSPPRRLAALPSRQDVLGRGARGALRGIHYAEVPPGQATYATCLRAAALDASAGIRTGSSSDGRREAVRPAAVDQHVLRPADGPGRVCLALEDDTTLREAAKASPSARLAHADSSRAEGC